MNDQVRIGVAGAGVFGSYHASKYAAISGASLIGVFDPDSARAEALAGRHGVAAYDDFAKLIADVDALVVASPATAHYDQAYLALSRGKHVFVEKPMALHHVDAEKLCKVARAENLILQVGHQERFVLQAVGLLETSLDIEKVHCVRAAPRSGRCEDVSVVFDLMIHDIDLVRELTKAPAASIEANGDANQVDASLSLANGAAVEFHASRIAPALTRTLEIECATGRIFVDFVSRTIRNSTGYALDADALAPRAGPAFDPLSHGATQFIASIVNCAPVAVGGDAGAAAVEWAEAIEDSRLATAGPAKVESVCV